MKSIDRLFAAPCYTIGVQEKHKLLLDELKSLTAHHQERCEPYREMLSVMFAGAGDYRGLGDIPYIPVQLFKKLNLSSVTDEVAIKVLTSSGTTSQQVSRIFVDRETSVLQTKALASIITSFIGPKRLPMIIVDSREVLQKGEFLNARGAGIIGLSTFGRDHFYALDDRMQLDLPGLKSFIAKHRNERILMFGFTFMIWQYVYEALRREGETLDLGQTVLIHGGGWKKLHDRAITNAQFKEALSRQCGIQHVHNYYGMIEQTGSIYMECEHGYLHASNFSDILIRNHRDWGVVPTGESGIIQTLSVLPRSYPGHSLLTEDIGVIHGIDDCPCGRMGTYFCVEGRMMRTQLRGCSDVLASTLERRQESGRMITQFLPVRTAAESMAAICSDDFVVQTPMKPFNANTIDFLSDISNVILQIPDIRNNPELVALGYWLRKANIHAMRQTFLATIGDFELLFPRGLSFHVTPSNVDTIFVYSWALSLLAGNLNVVRISQTMSAQLELLLVALLSVFSKPQWNDIAKRNLVLSYPHDDTWGRFLSERADVRMIWGGDAAVQAIRALPAKPWTKDISFTDKVSYTVVHAERYLRCSTGRCAEISRLFFNDAYQFDQAACSSPRFVFFLGTHERCLNASEQFWKKLLQEITRQHHQSAPLVESEKLVSAYMNATTGGASIRRIALSASYSPMVLRIPLVEASARKHSRCGGGFFFESFIGALNELLPFVRQGDQTLSYVEFDREEMKHAAEQLSLQGIDRIVPVGQSLVFTPVWDGYVLLNELTRRIGVY